MHVVVLRRDVYGQRPWLAQHLMGPDFWSYGLEGNAETLGTFVRYASEQGLIKRRPAVEELFAAQTREEYVI